MTRSLLRKVLEIVIHPTGASRIASKQPNRYDTLHRVFENDTKCKRNILEVGTYNGNTAIALINIARRYESIETIHYYGFDLFEDLDNITLSRETSKKPTRTREQVKDFIVSKTGIVPEHVHLHKGFTQTTLWSSLRNLPKMDFIFIDGGHSFETVDNDWRACSELIAPGTVVVFDDYYHFEHGPRLVVDRLDKAIYAIEILEPQDVFQDRFGISKDGVLKINMVNVKLK